MIAASTGVASPVFAIGNPTSVRIYDVAVFQNVLTTGDQIYFVRYDVQYASQPSEPARETWQMELREANGSRIYVRPLNYYQHNVISIYLTPSQALSWEGAHIVRIMGMPSVFWSLQETVNMRTATLTSGDYRTDISFCDYVLNQAGILQDDWGITLVSSETGKLNVTGAKYMREAVPGLNQMCPGIFAISATTPTVERQEYNLTYAKSIQGRMGDRLSSALDSIAAWMGGSKNWLAAIIVMIIAFSLGGIVYAATSHSMAALLFSFPILVVFAWLGLGIELMTAVAVVVFLLALLFGIVFILARFA